MQAPPAQAHGCGCPKLRWPQIIGGQVAVCSAWRLVRSGTGPLTAEGQAKEMEEAAAAKPSGLGQGLHVAGARLVSGPGSDVGWRHH